MANRIYIKMFNQISSEEDYILDSPIQEDIALEITTNFQDVSDLFPSGLESILQMYQTGSQIMGNKSKYIEDLIGQPLWQKTEPIRISTDLVFYLKTDPIKDVIHPTLSLCSLTVLTDKNETGELEDKKTGKKKIERFTTYKMPGLAFNDAKLVRGKGSISSMVNDTDYSKAFKSNSNSTICSILIPGIIFLPVAMVTSAKPTFSKEVTQTWDGQVYPIWAKVGIEIRSITPASLSMLKSQYSWKDQLIGSSQMDA